MTRHIAGRRKKVARFRRRFRAEYLLMAAVVAAFLAFQTWSEHRLDILRQQRFEFEEQILAVRADLSAANLEFTRQSAQERIVARARSELNFVDASIGERNRVARPAESTQPEDPLLWRLASGLDRFSGIRGAVAAEDKR
jgi:hypothetical protein